MLEPRRRSGLLDVRTRGRLGLLKEGGTIVLGSLFLVRIGEKSLQNESTYECQLVSCLRGGIGY